MYPEVLFPTRVSSVLWLTVFPPLCFQRCKGNTFLFNIHLFDQLVPLLIRLNVPFSHIVFTRNPSACYSHQLLMFTPTPPIVHTNSYYSQFLCSHQFLLFSPIPPLVHTSSSYCSPTNSYCSYQLILLFTPTPAIIHNSYVHTNSYCSQQLLLLFTQTPGYFLKGIIPFPSKEIKVHLHCK